MRRLLLLAALVAALGTSSPVRADMVNGGFEAGNFSGWTQNGGNYNSSGTYSYDGTYRNAIVTAGNDPIVGALLNRVHTGTYSARIEDINNGFKFSQISQQFTWNSNKLYFAYASVFQDPNHDGTPPTDNPHMRLQVIDVTNGNALIYDNYYDSNNMSNQNQFGSYVYTPWQEIELNTVAGNEYKLTLIASDCALGGHGGYVYLDGFGAFSTVPAPAGVVLLGMGALLAPVLMRRRLRAAAKTA